MKVLGGTLDAEFDTESGQLTPKLIDREGHEMDPNAWGEILYLHDALCDER